MWHALLRRGGPLGLPAGTTLVVGSSGFGRPAREPRPGAKLTWKDNMHLNLSIYVNIKPDGLDVGVLFSDVDLTDRAEVTLALSVRRDLTNSPKVGVLLLHPAPLLPSLRAAVLVLKGSADGSCVRVLLPDFENPLRPPHLDCLVGSTFHGSLVRPWMTWLTKGLEDVMSGLGASCFAFYHSSAVN